MAQRVRITDVSPRDGLQNEPGFVATPDKARLVEALAATGVDEVEVTSFVSPRWVAQLGDAAALCALVAPTKPAGVLYSALVPNEAGARALLEANDKAERACGRRVIDRVSVFTAASETFSKKNTNASIAESIARFVPVVRLAREAGLSVRAYLSCAVRCPFEGDIPAQRVALVAQALADLPGGVDDLDLGDTIGAGEPETITLLLNALTARLGDEILDRTSLHLHDTHGRAAACARVGLELGVRSFDASVGGLGGCPYASTPQRRAPGNLDTRTLVAAVRGAGRGAGLAREIDDRALDHAAGLAQTLVAQARAGAGSGAGSGADGSEPSR